MSHFCLDQSANASWKPQILHTSYLSGCPAPQAGSPWEGGGAACGRTASALTSSSPAPTGPPAGWKGSPPARRAMRPAPK